MLPEILSESEEGFVDLVFSITKKFMDLERGMCFEIQAAHQGEIVGLNIELSANWKFQKMGDLPCSTGKITYRSPGELGDRFVILLDRLYGTNFLPTRMNPATSFAAITLGGDPSMLESSAIRIKLFHEHGHEAQYAEIYTNFDLKRNRIQIREKDPGHRYAIIRALTKNIEV
jgi:hypothetical protein